MGSKLTCCLGPSGGLNCDSCRPDVGPCHECEIPETVAAAAPASTTAKPAKLDLKAAKAQHMQYLSLPKTPKMPKMPKGLDAHSKRWLKIIWRRHGIWPLENIGPTEDVQASAHSGVEENITSDIEISEAEHDHHLVKDLNEGSSVCLEDLVTQEMAKERCEDYLCWVKMAQSRLNEPISSQVRGLLRLPCPK
nr:uncharacterized protein C22orf42 homolog [Pongo abelii]XP_054399341.1 uncharacterized protein C22orf42 homolog [Pongo abelii]XP_054399342.1 uncharacterized protein C22orf42 homolog [Pongo abelii]XP_054399343.1 uncharacterized protein C22orf42 homolog [Pongo abelii]